MQSDSDSDAGPGPSTAAHRAATAASPVGKHSVGSTARRAEDEPPLGSWTNPSVLQPRPTRARRSLVSPQPQTDPGSGLANSAGQESKAPTSMVELDQVVRPRNAYKKTAQASDTRTEDSAFEIEMPIPEVKTEYPQSIDNAAGRPPPGTWGNPTPYDEPRPRLSPAAAAIFAQRRDPSTRRRDTSLDQAIIPRKRIESASILLGSSSNSPNLDSEQAPPSPPLTPSEAPLGSWTNPTPLIPSNRMTLLGQKRRLSPSADADGESFPIRRATRPRRMVSPDPIGAEVSPEVTTPTTATPRRARPTWATAPPVPPPAPPAAPSPLLLLPETYSEVDALVAKAVSSPVNSQDPLLLNEISAVSTDDEVEETVEDADDDENPSNPM